MKIFDRTFATPEENLACDEALLERAEENGGGEVLRFWESPRLFAVLGFANVWKDEVKPDAGVPVLRRVSGGGAVLQGPGCLNYGLVLRTRGRSLDGVLSANRYVMEHQRAALESLLGTPVAVRGSTDLALGALKFSGNSQRRKRDHLLFHGTFLLDFDLSEIERCLKMPPKEPAYRQGRAHGRFLKNLGVPPEAVKETLIAAWRAKGDAPGPSGEDLSRLVGEKYGNAGWNLRR